MATHSSILAVDNNVGLNTMSREAGDREGRSLDRRQALRLRVRRGDCGRGVLPEGGPD